MLRKFIHTQKIHLNSINFKYQLIFNGKVKVGIKKLKNSKDYSKTIDDAYENLKDKEKKC